jgi:hypothetical protein
VVVPVVGGHFHVVNIQGRAPENEEERKERHERGETSRATQWNNLTKKLFSTRDGEKTFSFWLLLLDISVEDFVDLTKARKNLFQMGKLGRVLFVFLLSQQRLDLCFFPDELHTIDPFGMLPNRFSCVGQ